jgi:hypothetical protein
MKWKIIAVLSIFSSLLYAQDVTVKTDTDPDSNLDKYKTFYWASQVDDKLDSGFLFMHDLALKEDIREAVKHEMEGRGYKVDQANPDLIVNFRVFEEPSTLKGYESYGTSYWSGQTVADRENLLTYEVQPGTLLISLLEKKSGHIVWQGFASGLLKEKEFEKDEAKIKQAVNLIFEEYDHRADGYSSR